MNRYKKISSNIQSGIEHLAHGGLRKIFDQIDQLGIKKGVDKMGVDNFINLCARMAAGTGIISGSGGMITMAIGIPVDVVNMITQQFRVTLAIIYHERGNYQIGFDEFVSIVAVSLKVEAGVAVTKNLLEGIAEKLLTRIGSKAAGKLIPIVGGIIGGTANYLFIKGIAEAVKKMQPRYYPIA